MLSKNYLLVGKASLLLIMLLGSHGHVHCQTRARVSLYGIPPFHFTTPDDSFLVVSTPYNGYGTIGSTKMISKATNDTIWEYDSFLLGEIFVSEKNEIVAVNRSFYPIPDFDNIAMTRLYNGKAATYRIRDLINKVPDHEIDDFTWSTSVFLSDSNLMYVSKFNIMPGLLIDGQFSEVEIVLDSFPSDPPTNKFPPLLNGKILMDDFNSYSNTYRIIDKDSDQTGPTPTYMILAPVLVHTSGTQSRLLKYPSANNFDNLVVVDFFDHFEAYLRDEAVFLKNQTPEGFDRWCFGGWVSFEVK